MGAVNTENGKYDKFAWVGKEELLNSLLMVWSYKEEHAHYLIFLQF